jgi:hypothetical protein
MVGLRPGYDSLLFFKREGFLIAKLFNSGSIYCCAWRREFFGWCGAKNVTAELDERLNVLRD